MQPACLMGCFAEVNKTYLYSRMQQGHHQQVLQTAAPRTGCSSITVPQSNPQPSQLQDLAWFASDSA